MLSVIRRTDWFAADAARAKIADDALFDAFVGCLRTDPRFYAKGEEELLARYRDTCKRIDAKLPALFGTLPRNPYGVRAVPKFMAPTQTTAYYMPGSLRAGNPGWFYANTHALEQRPLYEMVPLSLHEAVPGHHLQISIAQELPDQPEFRRDMHFTAFVEGWALYAERLGIEMGFFENDPYSDFGRLTYEMWRSTRLVVDTGIHAFGWSKERAMDFMKRNTALSELNIEREVDRYIDWPGQACGYKIGELRIRAMRAKAEGELGASFDVRAFHDAVLGAGAIPLDVLALRIDAWIVARKAAQASSAQPSS
jgi:prolyl oligopeptidase